MKLSTSFRDLFSMDKNYYHGLLGVFRGSASVLLLLDPPYFGVR